MKTGNTFKLDKHIERNKGFWSDLEIHCVPECCGIDAFDFSKDTIQNIISFYNKDEVICNIKSAISEIKESNKIEVSSYILNSYFKKNEVISLLIKITKNIEK